MLYMGSIGEAVLYGNVIFYRNVIPDRESRISLQKRIVFSNLPAHETFENDNIYLFHPSSGGLVGLQPVESGECRHPLI